MFRKIAHAPHAQLVGWLHALGLHCDSSWYRWDPNSAYPTLMTAIGGVLYFCALDPGEDVLGMGPSRSDSSDNGIYVVKRNLCPYEMLAVNGLLVMSASGDSRNWELWRSDGTAAGTVLAKDIAAVPRSPEPQGFVVAGVRPSFSADDGSGGRELWMTAQVATEVPLTGDLVRPEDTRTGQHPSQ